VQSSAHAVSTYLDLSHDLRVTGVPALFYKLFANQWSGILTIQALDGTRAVYFLDGEPVFAESDALGETLEATLVESGAIGAEDADAIMEVLGHDQTLADMLLRMELIEEDELVLALRLNARHVCVNLFDVEEGPYRFEQGEGRLEGVPRFPQNPIELIATGLRRNVTPTELGARIEKHTSQYVVRTEKFDWFRLHLATSELESRWMNAIDGTRTLRGLAALNSGHRAELMAFMSILRSADLIDFLDAPRITAERSPHKRPLREVTPIPDYHRMPTLPRVTLPASDLEPILDDADAIEDAADVRLGEIIRRLREGVTYAELLGVDETASESTVHRAYRSFVESLRGEGFDGMSEEQRERAVPVLRAARDACNNLSDPEGRSFFAYRTVHLPEIDTDESSVGFGRPPLTQETIPAISRLERGGASERLPELESADEYFDLAKLFVDGERWRHARHVVETGLAGEPDDPRLLALAGWILFNIGNSPRQRQKARQRVLVSLGMSDGAPEPYLYMGRIEEAMGFHEDALQLYRSALALSPDCIEARTLIARVEAKT